MAGRKRARLSNVRGKRPIDKDLIVVNQTTTTSVTTTALKTTTFPCTVVGIRWVISTQSLVASTMILSWAIVITRDGDSVNTPSQSNGASFYQPEQDVLMFGVTHLNSTGVVTDQIKNYEGMTKTMRKLKAGDVLNFITINSDANGASLDAIIQFFCKS